MPLIFRRRKSGYTLVEVMATVAIVGVAMGMGAQLFIQFQKFYISSIARAELQRDGRVSLELMSKIIRQAQLSSLTITTDLGQSTFDRIRFTTPDGREWIYYQNGNKLMQQVTDVAANINISILTRNLYYLSFYFPNSLNPRLLNISMALSKPTFPGQHKELQMPTQFILIEN